MCVNLCKTPVQTFFTQQLGMPLTMKPNFEDYRYPYFTQGKLFCVPPQLLYDSNIWCILQPLFALCMLIHVLSSVWAFITWTRFPLPKIAHFTSWFWVCSPQYCILRSAAVKWFLERCPSPEQRTKPTHSHAYAYVRQPEFQQTNASSFSSRASSWEDLQSLFRGHKERCSKNLVSMLA